MAFYLDTSAAVKLVVSERGSAALLESLTVMTLASSTFERAAELEPDLLLSLDALHLAASLELEDDLEGIVTYDDRLAEAAHRYGIQVIAPRPYVRAACWHRRCDAAGSERRDEVLRAASIDRGFSGVG